MTSPWRKAVRDVWHERTRSALVMLAIAIGLTGFLAVMSTYTVLRREIDRGYSTTNPASATLVTDGVDEALLATIMARSDMDDADARKVVAGRMRTPSGEWLRLVVFVIRDFAQLRINTVFTEAGEWPPQAGSILIERDAFQVATARIGDTVTIEWARGREQRLRVAGRVHDPGQAQARMENIVYGYVTPATLTQGGESPVLERLLLRVAGDRFDSAHVTRVANDVKKWLEGTGHVVDRVDVPTPGEHPHAAIMGVLLLAMAAFGLLTLALSGVIVANLLLAIMASQRRQIGVMKAIGGTRRQIAGVYLAEAGLLGAGAIVLAAPAGIVSGRLLTRYFGVLLNFDITSFAVPPWIYLLAGAVGLLVPLAAAAYPVAACTTITVRDALSDGRLDAAFGVGRLDWLLSRVGGAGRPMLLAVRNLARRPARTALTLGTLSAAGAFFVSALSIRASMMAAADRAFGAGTFGAASRYSFDQHMLMIYVFLLVGAGVLGSVGGLGLVTATSLNVLDRRREFGVLRAIGASPATISGIVIMEAIVLAHLSWGLGVAAAWPMTAGVGRLIAAALFRGGFETTMSAAGISGWLGISTALCVMASLVPAVTAARRSVREAVSYE